jgi:hypothetical protein
MPRAAVALSASWSSIMGPKAMTTMAKKTVCRVHGAATGDGDADGHHDRRTQNAQGQGEDEDDDEGEGEEHRAEGVGLSRKRFQAGQGSAGRWPRVAGPYRSSDHRIPHGNTDWSPMSPTQ